MSWIKEVVTDILVTIFITAAVISGAIWMWWIIIGYTGLMLLARIMVLAADNSLQLIRKTQTNAPDWFYHLLFALNTGILLSAEWWYAAAGWLAIWILSFVARQKAKVKSGN